MLRTIVAPILESTGDPSDDGPGCSSAVRVDSKDEIGDLKEQINSLYQHLLTVIGGLA